MRHVFRHSMRQCYSFILLICSALTLLTSVSAADSEKVIFSTSNVKPWGYMEEGIQKGLLVDLTNALTAKTGMTVENNIRPYPRVIREFKNGSIDLAFMFRSPQAEEIGIPVEQILTTKIVLIALEDAPEISNLDELSKKYVGHISGSKYGAVFDNSNAFNKVPLDSLEQGIKMLLSKRLYAVASAEQTFYYTLKELEIPQNKIKPIMIVNQVPVDLYLSKKSLKVHLIETYRQAIVQLKKEGVLNTIFYEGDFMPVQ